MGRTSGASMSEPISTNPTLERVQLAVHSRYAAAPIVRASTDTTINGLLPSTGYYFRGPARRQEVVLGAGMPGVARQARPGPAMGWGLANRPNESGDTKFCLPLSYSDVPGGPTQACT